MLDTTETRTNTLSVPISMLRPGDEAPGGSINVRKTTSAKDEDEATKASLLDQGVVQSLAVFSFEGDEALFVGAGNRRLRLLRELLAEGKIGADYQVPVIVHYGKTPAEARQISLTENVARAPLHPVDRFEAFKQHVDDGMSEAEIAARYAMPKKAVRQALALGALSPKVRDAWREGKIDAETARAFTLAPSHERQDEVLDAQGDRVWAHSVRHAILGDQHDVSGALKFVGKKAYEAAGGTIIEDLFEGGKHVSDPALLKQLVDEKLQDECARIEKEDGWSWALTADQASNERYSWRRIHAEPKLSAEQAVRKAKLDEKLEAFEKAAEAGDDSYDYEEHQKVEEELEQLIEEASAAGFTAEQKAKSGCIIRLRHDGTVEVVAGYVKPADKAGVDPVDMTPAERPKAKAKKGSGGISEALLNRLTMTLTEASAAALTKDPKTALCVLLAGFLTTYGSPVCVRSDGMGARRDFTKPARFETVFARLLEMTDKERNAVLTKVAGEALDLRLFTAQRNNIDAKAHAALTAALPAVDDEARKRFDAKDYFGSVSKPLCLQAIEEAVSKDAARKIAGKPKGEIVKFAVANVPKTGWLPAALRTAHYTGPGAKAAKKGKAAPKKKAA